MGLSVMRPASLLLPTVGGALRRQLARLLLRIRRKWEERDRNRLFGVSNKPTWPISGSSKDEVMYSISRFSGVLFHACLLANAMWLVPAEAFAAADVVAESCYFGPDPVQVGERVWATVVMTNVGDEDATFKWPSHWWEMSDADTGQVFGNSPAIAGYRVPAGQTVYQTASVLGAVSLPPGTHSFIFTLDAEAGWTESDTSNNQVSCDLVVEERRLPDWVVSQIIVNPQSGTTEDVFTVDVALTNQGNGSGLIPVQNYILNCGTGGIIRAISGDYSLEAGQTDWFQFTLSGLPPATYWIDCIADPVFFLEDSNRDNNVTTVSFNVDPPPGEYGSPDLVPDCHFYPANPSAADQVRFLWEVVNQGTASAYFQTGSNAYYHIYRVTSPVSPAYQDWGLSPTSILANGGITYGETIKFQPGELSPGSYVFIMRADPNDIVGESDESNNTTTCTLDISSQLPDLAVSMRAVPETLTDKDRLTMYVDIENIGRANATVGFDKEILRCGSRLWHAYPSTFFLAPGEVQTYSVAFNDLTAGPFALTCEVDAGDIVPEYREDNNTSVFQTEVTEHTSRFLVAHYPFEGNADDISGNGFHGVVQGGETYVRDRNGHPAAALTFDGIGNYVELPADTAFDLAEFTLSATYVASNVESTQMVLSKPAENGGFGNYAIKLGPTPVEGEVSTTYNHDVLPGGNYVAPISRGSGLDDFRNVTVTYKDEQLNIYVDGELVHEYGSVPPPAFNAGPVMIGTHTNPTWGLWGLFHGVIDDVRIYRIALSDDQVATIENEQATEDADFDGIADREEAEFGGSGIALSGAANCVGGGFGQLPDGSTYICQHWSGANPGNHRVVLPPGTCVADGTGSCAASGASAELTVSMGSFDGETSILIVGNALLPSGSTKTVEMPVGAADSLCIQDKKDRVWVSGGFPGASCTFPYMVNVSPLPSTPGEGFSVNGTAQDPRGGADIDTVYTVTRLQDDQIRVEGLVNSSMYTMNDRDGDGVGDLYDVCADRHGWAEFQGCPGSIDIGPETLNACSKGKFAVTIYPGGAFGPEQVEVGTVRMNGEVPPVKSSIDGEGLVVRFDRQQLVEVLAASGFQVMTLSGALDDGTPFAGRDGIRVIHPECLPGQ